MTTVKAQCPDGKIRTVTFTGLDHKGRPLIVDIGYRQGWVMRNRKKALGWTSWLISGWRFHFYGTDEIAKYAPSVGRGSKFRPWKNRAEYNTRHRQ